MYPIRCFTCNKVLGHFSGCTINNDFFKENNIKRYCCKKILISSVDIHKHLYGERNKSFYNIKKYTEVEKILLAR